MTSRSKFLRLMWSQAKADALTAGCVEIWTDKNPARFTVIKALDGLDYVVPVPVRGPIKAPRCKLERRVVPCES